LKTAYIVSLGCDKNRVDTEHMLYVLHKGGYGVAQTADKSDVIIVNTCAFIESARAEAIDTILGLAREKHAGQKLVVTGCLPQKYRDELIEGLPEVDAFFGVREYDKLCGTLDTMFNAQCTTRNDGQECFGRIRTTPEHYAYLRIADGCDNKCTFCTVPSIRGPYRSRSSDSLVAEAAKLAEQGVRELIIIAQDVTRYEDLCDLLDRLSQIGDIDYIRLMYCYPDAVDNRLIETIRDNPKIVKYIDMPMQHVSNKILRAMGRKGSGDDLRKLVDKLYAGIPGMAIRTTFMVGFPGETETEFNELKEFLISHKFRHAGFFAYSCEEDTPSHKLPGHVDEETKAARLAEIAALQATIVEEQNRRLIGTAVSAIYEDIDYERNSFIARPLFSAPEVDSLIYFTAPFADVGKTVKIEITGVDGYDLVGEITNKD